MDFSNAVLIVLAIPPALGAGVQIYRAFQDWRAGKPAEELLRRREWWGRLIYNLYLAALLIVVASTIWMREPSGFNAGWPDAIQCFYSPPTGGAAPSKYLFAYDAVHRGVQKLGDLVTYVSMRGSDETRRYYGMHEIWFSLNEKSLVRVNYKDHVPSTITVGGNPNMSYPVDELDLDGKNYAANFIPDINCGGDTLEAVVKAGNAFVYAKKAPLGRG